MAVLNAFQTSERKQASRNVKRFTLRHELNSLMDTLIKKYPNKRIQFKNCMHYDFYSNGRQ